MMHREEDAPKSKSRRKREAQDLQTLGAALVALPAAHWAALRAQGALPDRLSEAILACRLMTAREGRRRQLQYIGKLMRAVDAEPLRRALAAVTQPDRAAAAEDRVVAQWRERLLTEGEGGVRAFLSAYPQADPTRLQALLRPARQAPPRNPAALAASRRLFRYLRRVVHGPAY